MERSTSQSSLVMIPHVDDARLRLRVNRICGQMLKKGDHYACYRVLTAEPVNASVAIKDQFDNVPQTVRVLRPLYLGVPVRKRHGNRPEIGLAGDAAPIVTTNDQFGMRRITMAGDMVGVPSLKELIP